VAQISLLEAEYFPIADIPVKSGHVREPGQSGLWLPGYRLIA